nr:flavoprotein [Streptomyces sp. V1I1]
MAIQDADAHRRPLAGRSGARPGGATGHPVRSRYKLPKDPDVWPLADVAVLAPATFNTINQWALGITEKFVVGFVAEGTGKGIPVITMLPHTCSTPSSTRALRPSAPWASRRGRVSHQPTRCRPDIGH